MRKLKKFSPLLKMFYTKYENIFSVENSTLDYSFEVEDLSGGVQKVKEQTYEPRTLNTLEFGVADSCQISLEIDILKNYHSSILF